MNSVEIKSVDEDLIRQSVDEYAATLLSSHPEIIEVIVFGSFVTRTFVPGSDVDIFILLSDSDKSVRDRIPDYMPTHFPVSVDIFPYTMREVAAMQGSPIVQAMRLSPWRYRNTEERCLRMLPSDAE